MADGTALWPGFDVKAFVSGCSGTSLTGEERAFFRAEQPFGLILFGRNCETPDQIAALTAAFREAVDRADAPVLIDQEGGRVQRLKPPHWPAYAPAAVIGALAEKDRAAAGEAAWLHGRLIAGDLDAIGIDVNCAPVLDVLAPNASEAIGDRSFGADAGLVADLGRQLADGLAAGGVLPVMKHIPGQGRATTDSHVTLPVVEAPDGDLAATDMAPFRALAGLPAAMTSHVVYRQLDPDHAATVSRRVVQGIIRERIGFDGLLFSDDVSMDALSGDYGHRSVSIRDAGCDIVLHCNGRTEEMRAIADATPVLDGVSLERAATALTNRRTYEERAASRLYDRGAARVRYDALLARAGWASPA